MRITIKQTPLFPLTLNKAEEGQLCEESRDGSLRLEHEVAVDVGQLLRECEEGVVAHSGEEHALSRGHANVQALAVGNFVQTPRRVEEHVTGMQHSPVCVGERESNKLHANIRR